MKTHYISHFFMLLMIIGFSISSQTIASSFAGFDINLIGSGALVDNELQLTSQLNQTGAAWNTAPWLTNNSLHTHFDFALTSQSKMQANGIAFVMYSSKTSMLEQSDYALGLSGLQPSIEFSVQSMNNNIGIFLNGNLYERRQSVNLKDIRAIQGRIDIAYEVSAHLLTMTANLYLDGKFTTVTDNRNVDLSEVFGPVMRVGFIGSSAAAATDQRITGWQYDGEPRAAVPQIASGSLITDNDSVALAVPIIVNDKPLLHILNQPGEEKWFEFYAKEGLRHTCDIPNITVGKMINPAMALYDASGKEIVSTDEGGRQIIRTTRKGFYYLKVTNLAPLIKRTSDNLSDYSYQIRIFLTDVPQQGIIKGSVLETCNHSGVKEAEVLAYLNNGVSDSTLTHKTGEFGLQLNPNSYTLKVNAQDYQQISKPFTLKQEDDTTTEINISPISACNTAKLQQLDPITRELQATAIYNAQSQIFVIKNVVIDNRVYYVELINTGGFHFQVYRFFELPGVSNPDAPRFNSITQEITLSKVWAFNKNWELLMKIDNSGVSLIQSKPLD